MKFTLIPKSEEKKWDHFVEKHQLQSIHQSSHWGHFQASIPYRGKYWIAALEDEGKIIAGTLLIRQKLPKGYSWLYAPRGPLLDYQDPEQAEKQMQGLLQGIQSIAKKEKAVFLRIDPEISVNQMLELQDFSPTPHGFQPECTLTIDITETEDQILAQMKQKGRYNIKVAEKKGVTVRKSHIDNATKFNQDLESFYGILEETTSRDGFSGHPIGYYKNMLQTLGQKHHAELYLAEYEDQIIAGLIATFYHDTAIYYYGASSNKHRNVMAPYLLQWRAIQEAKKRGCKTYDFLGIAKTPDPKDPWHGITRFKTRFGGEQSICHKAHEHSFRPLIHFLYKLYKKIR